MRENYLKSAFFFYLNREEGANDMDGGLFLGWRRSGLLFRQFNDAAGHALQLSDVLTAFADDTTDLGAGHEDFNGQSNVFSAGDVSFLPHFFKDQVLGLKRLQFLMMRQDEKDRRQALSSQGSAADRKSM